MINRIINSSLSQANEENIVLCSFVAIKIFKMAIKTNKVCFLSVKVKYVANCVTDSKRQG